MAMGDGPIGVIKLSSWLLRLRPSGPLPQATRGDGDGELRKVKWGQGKLNPGSPSPSGRHLLHYVN